MEQVTGAGQLTHEELNEWISRGRELRQKAGEKEAYDYLKVRQAAVCDSGIFEMELETQDNIELFALACDVMIEYAATCTQQAFREDREDWHLRAVDIEQTVWRWADEASRRVAEGLDLSPIVSRMHRAGNSLTVSFQRPKRLFSGRDTDRSVGYGKLSSEYYLKKGREVLKGTAGSELDEEQKALLLNCIRYCGNYASALYQRGEDRAKKGDVAGAIESYGDSVRYREKIESELIRPAFGERSLQYLKSLQQHAGVEQAKAKCGARGGYERARDVYRDVIRQLKELERECGSETSDGGCVTYQISRLSAQYGLAWCLLNMGNLEGALELHRQVRDERENVLGADHLDVKKSADAVDTVTRAIAERDRACGVKGKVKGKGARRG